MPEISLQDVWLKFRKELLTSSQIKDLVNGLSFDQANQIIKQSYKWIETARADQLPPSGDWLIWLLLGGRGSGKTRAGAEWTLGQVRQGVERIALVAPTYNDAREVMIEGESGLLNIGQPHERPVYLSSRRRLVWPNGAIGQIFSSEDPDGLRGPQFEKAWADEFCAWAYPEESLSNLRFGLRLGAAPQLVMTTTPKPIAALKKIIGEKNIEISKANTKANQANLSPAFMKSIYDIYGGTRLGRQELEGEIMDDTPGALWSRALIDRAYCQHIPQFEKIIVAVDPPVTSTARADSCGIIVAGREGFGENAKVYILHDGTVQGYTPEGWAQHANNLWQEWDADIILVEVNQGGDMVKSVFRAIGVDPPLSMVYASKGKTARAEPVAALYEQGRVFHTQSFPDLENEMCALGSPQSMGKSPDRADALVWAVTDLLLKARNEPRMRVV